DVELDGDGDGEWEEVDRIGVEDFDGVEMTVVHDGGSHCCFWIHVAEVSRL
nr:hypothetical protein [Tanacetum cinerariifolium]